LVRDTKIVRFPDKDKHLVFLEPEGIDVIEIYPNGLSTSLPEEVQVEMYRSIPGLEKVEILKPAYAIEYDMVPPTELYPTLETKRIRGLFHAGNFNIGVMIDDLTTKGVTEPYRLFTSRSEYRLYIRQDNALLRLAHIGREVGLLDEERYKMVKEMKAEIEKWCDFYRRERIQVAIGSDIRGYTIAQLFTANYTMSDIDKLNIATPEHPFVREEVEIELKYEPYVERERKIYERIKKLEDIRIPDDIDYKRIPGLTKEAVEKLEKFRPITVGQASRIDGITPATITAILVYLGKLE